MATSRVLELARADGADDGPVLLHVTPKGDNALDLDIVATEGSSVFKGKIRKRNVKKLRASNYNGKEEDWEAILRHSLLEDGLSGVSDEQKRSLEITTSVKGRKLSINFRNRIDDITQRIGSVELSQDDDEQISLFDWLALTVKQKVVLEKKLALATEKSKADEESNLSLQSQLKDLVEAKLDQETQLISKFVLLLNEKKLHARKAAKKLAVSTPDEELLGQLRSSLKGQRTTSASRAGVKRAAENAGGANDSESEGFETMDVGRNTNSKHEDLDSDRATTATQSDDDEDVIMAPTPEPEKPTTRSQAAKQPSSPPARRFLPLAAKSRKRKVSGKSKSKTSSVDPEDNEETASEDDEL